MAPHKIVFLAGPPGCGKDTAGRALQQRHGERVRLYEMKMPMDRALRAFFDIDSQSWLGWERSKNAPLSSMDSIPFDVAVSLRTTKINFSELFAKPTFGKHIFGHLAAQRLKHTTLAAMTIITDSGFAHEAEPIVEAFGLRNCLLIHIHRPGHTFDGDSRSHWTMEGIKTMQVHNNNDKQMFIDLIDHGVAKWMTAVRA